MHESYVKGQESNQEVQRVVDNLFLIKILKKDSFYLNNQKLKKKIKFKITKKELLNYCFKI